MTKEHPPRPNFNIDPLAAKRAANRRRIELERDKELPPTTSPGDIPRGRTGVHNK